ncbi:hypothetical protein ACIPSE_01870 [Streptomyces sp. NPDC090106]|uniref:hypothetical protein n=1 Tax=Streptomyces sp. NPDC090106 TaxID=3365946 RepID=UPI0038143595
MSRVSDRVVERSRRFLAPDEQPRWVVLAQGGINPWYQGLFFAVGLIAFRLLAAGLGLDFDGGAFFGPLGGMIGFVVCQSRVTRRVLLTTDRAIVVLEYDSFGGVHPSRVLSRLPLDTPVGPLSGIWARTELAGERLWIHKKWQRGVPA